MLVGIAIVLLIGRFIASPPRPLQTNQTPTSEPGSPQNLSVDEPEVASEGEVPRSTKEEPMPTEAATPDPTPTSQPSEIIDQYLASMSLEEKVGQLFLVFFEGPSLSPGLRRMIEEYHIGGIVLFSISGNVESPEQVARMIADAQSLASTMPSGIPLFVAIDQEGGPVSRITEGVTYFPSQMALGATGSEELAREVARVRGRELMTLGINMVLAPVLDVNNNPDNPVIGLRSFGSNPEWVARLGEAMLEGYEDEGILATVKHFPGHGDTGVDSHTALPTISHPREHLDQIELAPFRQVITRSPALMTAHLLVSALDPERPATISQVILTDLLRNEMGYQGLIVTDSLGMGALDRTVGTVEAAQLALRAGADVLAFGADFGATPAEQMAAYHRILDLVTQGEISEARIDESVRRILEAKQRYGILDWTQPQLDGVGERVGRAEDRSLAVQVAEKSLTLVRDTQDIFPSVEGQMLFIWPQEAGELGSEVAGCRGDIMVRPISLNPEPGQIAELKLDAQIASSVVVVTLNARRHPAQVALIEALAEFPLAVVAMGEPYDILAFPWISTYVTTYGNVPVTREALARLLCGQISPEGLLPVELPGIGQP